MDRARILIVDDEETIRHVLVNVISWNNCEVREAGTAEDGLALLSEFTPDVALLDIVMPGKNGLELLKDIKQRCPDTEVVMMTSHASAETALRAIREGAYTYLQKPFENLDEIWVTIQRALEKRNLTAKRRSIIKEHDERSKELASGITLLDAGDVEEDPSAYADLLDYFMDMVCDELGIDHACILLLDERAGELRSACRRTEGTRDPRPVRVKLSEDVFGKVARSGTPYVLAGPIDIRAGGGGSGSGAGLFSVPIALCVPVKSDRYLLGLFVAGTRSNGEPFNEGDGAHLAALGSQLAVAVDGARRASRLQKAYEKLKAAQEQMVRSERLKAVGQLAAGVAHDFNNVLSVILARAELIRFHVQAGPLDRSKVLAELDPIIKAGLQGAQTIKRIQDYTRIRKDQPCAPVDLNAAVRDAIEIAKPKWKEEGQSRGVRIGIHQDLAEIHPVSGNLLELTQVVENLIFNAVEAMPKGGSISFRTTESDGTVYLQVTDTGTGMDEETQKRLFEPFFTTKATGQGLGTSIVYGIIARHQGKVTVESKPGSGTTFLISLPVHVPTAKESTPPPPAALVVPRTARVLLVDDDPTVRLTYEEALATAGHEVTAVASGEEAIARAEDNRFDVVVTDLSMGGISGYQVASAIKMIDPSLPVILLSGWEIDPRSEQVRQSGIDAVIGKPCQIEELRATVQRALRDTLEKAS